MKNSLFILLLFTAIFSCKSKQQAAKVDNSIFNRSDSDSLFVTIFHSQCFGRCPWYEAKIYESGYVVYSGKKDVPNIGNYSFQVSTEQLKELKQKAMDIKYFELKDKYDNEGVTDLPECVTSVQLDGKRKTIKNRYDGPPELREFEKVIEALFVNADMKKLPPTDEK
ncbi:MAG: DUF6438 domain-containing protein [Bacteroidia bacterium]